LRNPTEHSLSAEPKTNLSRLSMVVVNKILVSAPPRKFIQNKTSPQPLKEEKYTSQNRKAYILKQFHVLSTTRPDGQTSILKNPLMKNSTL